MCGALRFVEVCSVMWLLDIKLLGNEEKKGDLQLQVAQNAELFLLHLVIFFYVLATLWMSCRFFFLKF